MAMRITQGMTNRSYLYNLNTAQYNMNKSSEKLQTGRKYSHASDDVHGVTKSLSLKTKLYRNDRVQDGVADALNEFELAESTLESIGEIASTVQSEMIKAMDDVKRGSAKDTFLSFLKESKAQILRLANTKYNDKYIFGDLKTEGDPYITKSDFSGHTYMAFRDAANGVPLSEISSSKVDTTSDQYYNDNLDVRSIAYEEQYKGKGASVVYGSQALAVFNNKLDEIDSYVKEKILPIAGNSQTCWNSIKAGNNVETHINDILGRINDTDMKNKWIKVSDLYKDIKAEKNAFSVPNSNADEKIYVVLNKQEDAIGKYSIEYTGKTLDDYKNSAGTNVTQDYYYMHDGSPLDFTHNNYIDVGLDMSSKVNSNASKFNVTVDGLKALGYGTNYKTGIPNNLYDMLTEMEKAIENDDSDRLGAVCDQFKKQTDNLISSVAEIGIRGSFLESTLSRLESENTIMKEAQSKYDATDDATEITNFKGYQNAWNTVLQFGGSIFPKSLMDYVN